MVRHHPDSLRNRHNLVRHLQATRLPDMRRRLLNSKPSSPHHLKLQRRRLLPLDKIRTR